MDGRSAPTPSPVRAEVDFDANRIRSYALRRREPTSQPLRQCTEELDALVDKQFDEEEQRSDN